MPYFALKTAVFALIAPIGYPKSKFMTKSKAMKEEEQPPKKHPNLKPFKPGQSGNPNGRPAGGKNLKTLLKEAMDIEVDWKSEDGSTTRMTAGNVMIMHVLNKAISNEGDVNLILQIMQILDPGKTGPGVQINVGNSGKDEPVECFEIGGRKLYFGRVPDAEIVEEE